MATATVTLVERGAEAAAPEKTAQPAGRTGQPTVGARHLTTAAEKLAADKARRAAAREAFIAARAAKAAKISAEARERAARDRAARARGLHHQVLNLIGRQVGAAGRPVDGRRGGRLKHVEQVFHCGWETTPRGSGGENQIIPFTLLENPLKFSFFRVRELSAGWGMFCARSFSLTIKNFRFACRPSEFGVCWNRRWGPNPGQKTNGQGPQLTLFSNTSRASISGLTFFRERIYVYYIA